MSLAELRQSLARPSSISEAQRQRLLDLARRVAAVRELGGEYAGVALSGPAQAAIAVGIGH